MTRLTGGQALARALRAEGIDVIFGIVGEAYGAAGVKLRTTTELGEAVGEAVERGGVTVIECPSDFDAPPPWMP